MRCLRPSRFAPPPHSPPPQFGVIIPSTNTTVEHDFWRMLMGAQQAGSCKGLGFHMSSIFVTAPKLAGDADMLAFLAQVPASCFYSDEPGRCL